MGGSPFSIAYTQRCEPVCAVAVADTIKARPNDEASTPVVCAVGSHRSAGLVLIKHDRGEGHVIELPGPPSGATALLLSNKEGCVFVGGADGSLQHFQVSAACPANASSSARQPSQRTLLQPASEHSLGALISLALHQPSRTLAAGGGRYIHLLNLKESQIVQRLGPLPCEVLYLAWLGASTLLAGCAAGLHLWQDISTAPTEQDPPATPMGIALPSPPDLVYSAFAASSRAGHVAASTANTQQVLVWRKVAGNKSSISEPVILDSYKNEVIAMAWDGEGRLLATAEGSTVVVWDFERTPNSRAMRSLAIGGHSKDSQITCLEFDPLNEYLISAGDDGNVAMYATTLLAVSDPSRSVPPAVRLSLGLPPARLSTVKWLLGSPEHLVVVGAGGLVTVVCINRLAWRESARASPTETLDVNLNAPLSATVAHLSEAAARLHVGGRGMTNKANAPRAVAMRSHGHVAPPGPGGTPGQPPLGPRRPSGGPYANGTAVGPAHRGQGPLASPGPSGVTQPETPPLLRKGSSEKALPPGSGGRGRAAGMPIAGGRNNGRDLRGEGSSRSLASTGSRGPRASSPARSTSSKDSASHPHSLGRTSSGSHSMPPYGVGMAPWGMTPPMAGIPFAGVPYAAHPAMMGHMPVGMVPHPTMLPYYMPQGSVPPMMAYDDKGTSAGGSSKGTPGGGRGSNAPYPPGAMGMPPHMHPGMYPPMAMPIPYPPGQQAQMQRQIMAMQAQYMQHHQHMAMMQAQMQSPGGGQPGTPPGPHAIDADPKGGAKDAPPPSQHHSDAPPPSQHHSEAPPATQSSTPKAVVVPHPGAHAAQPGAHAAQLGATSPPLPPMPTSPPGAPHDDVTTLYVGNLAPQVDERALHELFGYFGPLRAVQVIRDKLTNVSRGFAFVSFTHAQAAQEAMAQVDRKPMYGPFEGRQVKVAPSSKRQQMQR